MKKNNLRKMLILLLILILPVPVYADYGSIEIDGYYDDWEDKPHTEVYEGKNPPAGKINYVSLFRDETNAYVHIEYARINNQTIDNMRVNLYTNLGNERYELVPDWDFDIFNYDNMTDSNNLDNISPETAPDETNNSESVNPETVHDETNNSESVNPETAPDDTTLNDGTDDGAGSGTDSNSTDNSTDSNNGDTSEPQQSDQILAGNDEVILVADEPTDPKSNNGQDKKDSEEQDPADSQVNNNDSTDTTTNNGQDKKDTTDTTDTTDIPDTNNDTNQNEEGDVTDPDTITDTDIITDPFDIFDPGNIIDVEDILDSLDPDNNPDDEWNPFDPNGDYEDQNNQEDPQDLEFDWNYHHPGYYDTWSFTVYQGHDAVGYGYFTRSEGEPDEAEFYIPLDTITDEVDGITEITMTIKKLGKQSVICVGASTAPYIGIAISSAIVLMSVAGYSYKKQRPLIFKKG